MDTPPPDPKDLLDRQRLAAALAAARSDLFTPTDPETRAQQAAHPALRLTETERDAIRHALADSPRLLAGFAARLLDRYDGLHARHRYEALDLFADIVHHPHDPNRNSCGLNRAEPPHLDR